MIKLHLNTPMNESTSIASWDGIPGTKASVRSWSVGKGRHRIADMRRRSRLEVRAPSLSVYKRNPLPFNARVAIALSETISSAMAMHSVSRRVPQGLRLARRFSTSPRTADYADTLPNLKIGAHTRVLFQGFTGNYGKLKVCISPNANFS